MARRYKIHAEESDGDQGWSVEIYDDGEWVGGCWWPTYEEAVAMVRDA